MSESTAAYNELSCHIGRPGAHRDKDHQEMADVSLEAAFCHFCFNLISYLQIELF